MNKMILIGVCICLLILVGCDDMERYGVREEQTCKSICFNEGLTLSHATGAGDTLFCHCEKIISIPNS